MTKLMIFLACFVGDGYPVETCRDLRFESDTVLECPGSTVPLDITPNGAPGGEVYLLSTALDGSQKVTWAARYEARGPASFPLPARVNYILSTDPIFRDDYDIPPCACHTRVSNGCP